VFLPDSVFQEKAHLLFNKIRDKGRTGSVWKWRGGEKVEVGRRKEK
jgi:hypothetical protein